MTGFSNRSGRSGDSARRRKLRAGLASIARPDRVGGAIKRYSCFPVPFIAAENPDIRPKAAINLSRRMMDGHKWELFRPELSFIGWRIPSFVTFGAVDAASKTSADVHASVEVLHMRALSAL